MSSQPAPQELGLQVADVAGTLGNTSTVRLYGMAVASEVEAGRFALAAIR